MQDCALSVCKSLPSCVFVGELRTGVVCVRWPGSGAAEKHMKYVDVSYFVLSRNQVCTCSTINMELEAARGAFNEGAWLKLKNRFCLLELWSYFCAPLIISACYNNSVFAAAALIMCVFTHLTNELLYY